jgi:5-methylcytosine-specific restriction endonuclease McrA
MTKFKIYEALATAQTNEALREMCKTRGIKGVSTLSKQELVGNLLVSNIHMYSVFEDGDQSNPLTGCVKTPVFEKEPKKTTESVEVKKEKAAKAEKSTDPEKLTFEPVHPEPSGWLNYIGPTQVNPEPSAWLNYIGPAQVKPEELLTGPPPQEYVSDAKAKPAKGKKPADEKCLEKPSLKSTELESKTEEVKKMAIPKKVKTDVWNTFIGPQIPAHKCLCCLKTTISNTDFHVGHVVSEFNGGNLNIDNLRPICASCNYSMGTLNLKDYVTKYGYFY